MELLSILDNLNRFRELFDKSLSNQLSYREMREYDELGLYLQQELNIHNYNISSFLLIF